MSQPPSDKYVYFTVGILKGSTALEAFKQDALKHHMVDQPGQLIALRLTEYYEMMNKGIVQPMVRIPAIITPPEAPEANERERSTLPRSSTPLSSASTPLSAPTPMTKQSQAAADAHIPVISQITGKMRALRHDNNRYVSTSPTADENADEAADYWSTL